MNVTNMNDLFYDCSNVNELPVISNCDISNVTDIGNMFINVKN